MRHKFFKKKFKVSSPKTVGVIVQNLFFQCLQALVTPLVKLKNAPYFMITFLNDLPK